MFTGYRLTILKICITFLDKIVEAAESVYPYDKRTVVALSTRRQHGNGKYEQFMGSVDSSQIKCKPDITTQIIDVDERVPVR